MEQLQELGYLQIVCLGSHVLEGQAGKYTGAKPSRAGGQNSRLCWGVRWAQSAVSGQVHVGVEQSGKNKNHNEYF